MGIGGNSRDVADGDMGDDAEAGVDSRSRVKAWTAKKT